MLRGLITREGEVDVHRRGFALRWGWGGGIRLYWQRRPFLFQQCETRRKLRGITKEEDEMKRSKYENTGIPKQIGSRLVRRPEVEAMTGLPKSTLYDYLQAGTFPPPVKLSARSVAWHLSAVQAWIDSRVSARPNQKAA